MPIEFASGALRLKPSLRVRWHGRSRLPELALAMSLATGALLFGASLLLAPNTQEASAGTDLNGMTEMRSAATNDMAMPLRSNVRVIRLDRASGDGTRV